eukprot:832536-Pyramimonas_sp.AAC.1
MEKVQSYGEAFAKIQQATGITDIDELVDKFMHAEDENFRLFNLLTRAQVCVHPLTGPSALDPSFDPSEHRYVDELNQEIAKFEEQISELIGEIELQRVKQTQQTQRKHIITDLEARLRETEVRSQTSTKTVDAGVPWLDAGVPWIDAGDP